MVTITLPSIPPNERKFLRDFLNAGVGFGGAWVAAHYTELGMSPELTAASVPLALYAWRQFRKKLGQAPEA